MLSPLNQINNKSYQADDEIEAEGDQESVDQSLNVYKTRKAYYIEVKLTDISKNSFFYFKIMEERQSKNEADNVFYNN